MLFFAHFSRVTDTLSPQLMEDLNILLKQAHRLLIGVIEITAGQRWLVPTLESISIAQMITQAVWSETSRLGRNTHLMQLPHFTEDSIRKCASKKWKITTILQIVKMEPDKRKQLLSEELGFKEDQIRDIERICDELPHDVDFTPTTEVDEDDENLGITAGAIVTFKTEFERPSKPRINPNPKVDDEPVDVHCPFFPTQKSEVWWLIVADEQKRLILGLKRIPSLRDKLEVKIPFQAPRKPGTYVYTVFLVSDSYVGFDKKKQLKITVKKELDWEKEKAKYKRDDDPELEDFYSEEELSDEEEGDKQKKDEESSSDSD
jgi:preprotein translocase subunit Sec63